MVVEVVIFVEVPMAFGLVVAGSWARTQIISVETEAATSHTSTWPNRRPSMPILRVDRPILHDRLTNVLFPHMVWIATHGIQRILVLVILDMPMAHHMMTSSMVAWVAPLMPETFSDALKASRAVIVIIA